MDGSEPESLLLDAENPPAPTPSEDGPDSEAGEKTEARLGQVADRLLGIGLPGRLQGHGAYNPVRRDTEKALEHAHGFRGSRMHGKIEQGEVEPWRKLIGENRIPVEAPIDGSRLLLREMPNIVDGSPASSGPGQGFASDAEVGRAPRIPRVLDETALMLQHEGKRSIEAG